MNAVGTAKPERPVAVTVAVALLWTDLALGYFYNFVATEQALRDWVWGHVTPWPEPVLILAALYASCMAVIHGVGRGAPWARWCVLPILGIALFRAISLAGLMRDTLESLGAREIMERAMPRFCWDCDPMPPGVFGMVPEEWQLTSQLIGIAQAALLTAATLLLFLSPGRQWFRTSGHATADGGLMRRLATAILPVDAARPWAVTAAISLMSLQIVLLTIAMFAMGTELRTEQALFAPCAILMVALIHHVAAGHNLARLAATGVLAVCAASSVKPLVNLFGNAADRRAYFFCPRCFFVWPEYAWAYDLLIVLQSVALATAVWLLFLPSANPWFHPRNRHQDVQVTTC